jgi:hypothetical protein
VAGASDFPHSRQEAFARGVINPQNGHILCDAKARPDGLRDDNNFETEALTPLTLMRYRVFQRSRVLFIRASPTTDDGRSGATILCKIAHKNEVSGLRSRVFRIQEKNVSELIDNHAHRISVVKEIIQHLHAGAAPDLVKERLRPSRLRLHPIDTAEA